MLKFFSIIALAVFLSGCSLLGTTPEETLGLGGVFKSVDAGLTWQSASSIANTTGAPQAFTGQDAVAMEQDPSDPKAIYYGALRDGLIYTYDQAQSWHLARDLGPRPIGGVAVDPGDKCTIYAVSNHQIFKSVDCNRSWNEVYADNDRNLLFTSIIIDHYDPSRIFVANSRGDIIRSVDAGISWQKLYHFQSAVTQIVFSPFDSRLMMATTSKHGLWRSLDQGETWFDFPAMHKQFAGSKKVYEIEPSVSQPGFWLLASGFGLLQTVNDGENWTEIGLLTAERRAPINDVALSRQTPSHIYYVTDYNFFSSVDGGVNWESRALPTNRRGWKLLVDPADDKVIYLGVSQRP